MRGMLIVRVVTTLRRPLATWMIGVLNWRGERSVLRRSLVLEVDPPICFAAACRFCESSVTLLMASMTSSAAPLTVDASVPSGQAESVAVGVPSVPVAVSCEMSVMEAAALGGKSWHVPSSGCATRTCVADSSALMMVVVEGDACGGRKMVLVPGKKLPLATATTAKGAAEPQPATVLVKPTP